MVSPIAGTALKVHPHAFVVLGEGGVGVLVHLGIDTVKLEGRGFEVLAAQGTTVEAGAPVVRWDTAHVVAAATRRRPGRGDGPPGGLAQSSPRRARWPPAIPCLRHLSKTAGE